VSSSSPIVIIASSCEVDTTSNKLVYDFMVISIDHLYIPSNASVAVIIFRSDYESVGVYLGVNVA